MMGLQNTNISMMAQVGESLLKGNRKPSKANSE
jgi:hypothetical protein